MKKYASALVFVSAAALLARAQIVDTEPGSVAGIPVNYTEAKTGSYTLPDPLTFADGSPVASAEAWRANAARSSSGSSRKTSTAVCRRVRPR